MKRTKKYYLKNEQIQKEFILYTLKTYIEKYMSY